MTRVNLIKPKVEEKPKVKKTKEPKKKVDDGNLDMIIAFDTTGSMSAYIEAVKTHIVHLVGKLFDTNPNLRIGVVAFGDYCDMPEPGVFGNAYQVLPLTNDKDKVIKFTKNASRTAGGDMAEFYELVIKKITEESDWRDNAKKAVLLIADSHPHEIGYSYGNIIQNSTISWREEAKKASERGIVFDTITISDVGWYKQLSEMTNGICLPFKTSSKTSQLIEAAAYSRGGSFTKGIFEVTMDMVADDAEMSAVYKKYSKNLE